MRDKSSHNLQNKQILKWLRQLADDLCSLPCEHELVDVDVAVIILVRFLYKIFDTFLAHFDAHCNALLFDLLPAEATAAVFVHLPKGVLQLRSPIST